MHTYVCLSRGKKCYFFGKLSSDSVDWKVCIGDDCYAAVTGNLDKIKVKLSEPLSFSKNELPSSWAMLNLSVAFF